MPRLNARVLGCIGSAFVLLVASPRVAGASLIFDSAIILTGQGFGAAPRDLTIQDNANPESGCVGIGAGGAFLVGPAGCMGRDAANDPNGVVNAGGDEPNPQNDNQKFGAPFASDRGIVRAADIGILFNATEPAGDAISIDDLTLKFFLDGTLVGSIDGSHAFPSTEPGNGVAGFVFRVDAAEMDYVNAILALGNIRFALESTLSGNFGGPESFAIVNLNGGGGGSGSGLTIPEPASLLLIGTAMLAAGWRLRNGKSRVSSKT